MTPLKGQSNDETLFCFCLLVKYQSPINPGRSRRMDQMRDACRPTKHRAIITLSM
jgi:hypothetical protein